MGKKNDKIKIPKKVLGFKLSKGSRKDLRRLLKVLEAPEARAIAVSATSVAIAYLAEKAAERKGPLRKLASKAASFVQPDEAPSAKAGVTKM